jgi:hypothetical protein
VAKDEHRPASVRRDHRRGADDEELRHPTGRALLVILGITVLIVLLALVNTLGQV